MRPALATLLLTGCFVTDAELEAALDRDQDGYQPDITGGPDCEPENPAVNPDAPELCGDGIDNDCDGNIDDRGIGEREWFADADADGWGTGEPVLACNPPEGHVAQLGDCDDTDAEISPNALDLCDGVDQDCDEVVDDDATFRTVFVDADQDGFGIASETLLTCGNPVGYADIAGDCDDADGAIQPGLDDFCDGIDQDCDGAIDEDAFFTTYFEDSDGDGVGTVDVVASTCDGPPASYVQTAGDCNDLDPAVVIPSWYFDEDGDDHGAGPALQTCVPPSRHVASNDDCDDNDAFRSPSITEVCENGIDDDCNPSTDCRISGTLVLDDPVLELPSLGADMVVVESFVAPPTPDVLVFAGGQGHLYDAATFVAGGTPDLVLPGTRPVSSIDVDGDGRRDLLFVDDTEMLVFGSATGSAFATISNLPSTNSAALWPRGAICDLHGFGAGYWYGAPGAPGDDGSVTFVPLGSGAIDAVADAAYTVPGEGGERLGLSVACTDSSGLMVRTEATTEFLHASDLMQAAQTSSPATSTQVWDAFSFVVSPGLDGVSPDGYAITEVDTADLTLQTSIWTPSDGAAETFASDAPAIFHIVVGDLDADGIQDAFSYTLGGSIFEVTYGDGQVGSISATAFALLDGESVPRTLRAYGSGDLDEDGYSDILIGVENEDASAYSIHVIYGTGQ